MRVCMWVCVLLITEVITAPDSWTRSQPTQTLHGLMMSIDERLHTLESAKWGPTLSLLEQRLETLEGTFRRLDTTFQDRLDKLERNMNSKELKDELTVEKLSHKVRDVLDSSYDRYSRRMGYAEERLEMSIKKVQMSVEGILNRMEKQQEDIQADVSESVGQLEDIKGYFSTSDDKLNSTHKAFQQHIQSLMSPNREELQRISGTLEQLGSKLNSSLGGWGWGGQSDGPSGGDLLTTLRIEGDKLTSKVNNIYNDIWRRIVSVESLVRELSRQSNSTRREVLEEVRSLGLPDHRDFPGDSQENFLEVALDAMERKLHRKLLDLGRKVDDRMDSLSATQNLVMESCFEGRGCHGLEGRLSQVLERIFDIFSDKIDKFANKTYDLDSLVMEMMELVKTQHSQLIRTVTHNTNMVVTLAKDSSDANKLLQSSVSKLTEKSNFYSQDLLEEFLQASNITRNVCVGKDRRNQENKNNNTKQENLLQRPLNVTTETEVFMLNKNNLKENITKKQDAGVLKITTDDLNILADNFTRDTTNTPKVVDDTLVLLLSTLSPNLTQIQLDSLLQFLNKSVSLDNLEAIIQNAEADGKDDTITDSGSLEVHDLESLNSTNFIENRGMLISEMSEESYNVSEEINDESDVYGIIETSTLKNMSENTNSGIEKIVVNGTGEVSPDEKDQLRVYMLLLSIKHGNFNTTKLRKEIQNLANDSVEETQQQVLPTLQRLCFGEEREHAVSSAYINNIMRDRLLLINQTLNDINLYEKIENICNTMAESMLQYFKTNETISDN